MRIHKEGTGTILIVLALILVLHFTIHHLADSPVLDIAYAIVALSFFIFILSFFRKPKRNPVAGSGEVLSPCDGKVVVIEETEEAEYFRGRRIQVSIFMSPLNVHVNYNPISGEVKYVRYHPGKHLVAWHPKSSTANERSTVVIGDGKHEILVRQIAGTVARRIVTYSKVEDEVKAGDELGFIKFGSRVDLFFPVGSPILVKLNQKVIGTQTIIGKFPS
jgi:phosphatidylserine decarboxylase